MSALTCRNIFGIDCKFDDNLWYSDEENLCYVSGDHYSFKQQYKLVTINTNLICVYIII